MCNINDQYYDDDDLQHVNSIWLQQFYLNLS